MKNMTYVNVITCNGSENGAALVKTRLFNKTLFVISSRDVKENNTIHRELTNCIADLRILDVAYSTEYYTYWRALLTLESR